MTEPRGTTIENVSSAGFTFVMEPEEEGSHQVPAALLGEELLALSALLNRANERLNGSETKLTVAVHANPRSGSLEIELLVQLGTIWEKAKALFASDGYATAKEILEYLGVTTTGGVIWLWRVLKGRKAKRVEAATKSEDGEERVTIVLHNETIIVEKVVFELAADEGLKRAGSRLLGPALAPGIASIAFKADGQVVERIDRAEAAQIREEMSSVEEPLLEPVLPASTRRAILYPVKVWFQKGNKWQLTDGDARYNVEMLDEAFLEQVEKGAIALSHVTELDVEIGTETLRGPAGVEARHVVTKVHSWRQPRSSRDLFEPGE